MLANRHFRCGVSIRTGVFLPARTPRTSHLSLSSADKSAIRRQTFRFGFRRQNAAVVGATVAARFLGDQDALRISTGGRKTKNEGGRRETFFGRPPNSWA